MEIPPSHRPIRPPSKSIDPNEPKQPIHGHPRSPHEPIEPSPGRPHEPIDPRSPPIRPSYRVSEQSPFPTYTPQEIAWNDLNTVSLAILDYYDKHLSWEQFQTQIQGLMKELFSFANSSTFSDVVNKQLINLHSEYTKYIQSSPQGPPPRISFFRV